EGHQKTLEIIVPVQGFDFGEGRVIALTFAQLEQSRRLNRALQMQEQFRLGQLRDEGVGRPREHRSHPSDCRFLTQDLRECGSSLRDLLPAATSWQTRCDAGCRRYRSAGRARARSRSGAKL